MSSRYKMHRLFITDSVNLTKCLSLQSVLTEDWQTEFDDDQ